MHPPQGDHSPWNLPSLLEFDRPSHAAWSDVVRGAGITTLLGWIALSLDDPRGLLPLTLGSVFTAIAETGQGREHPWRTMAWTTSWLTLAAGFGAAVGENTTLAILASGAMGLICASAATHHTRTAVTSLLTLVVFTIYVGYPSPMASALHDMGLILVVRWTNPQGTAWLPLSLLGAGILIAYVWVHYATAVVGLTIWIVAAFALVGDPVIDTLWNRMLDTTMASAIILFAVWIDLRVH